MAPCFWLLDHVATFLLEMRKRIRGCVERDIVLWRASPRWFWIFLRAVQSVQGPNNVIILTQLVDLLSKYTANSWNYSILFVISVVLLYDHTVKNSLKELKFTIAINSAENLHTGYTDNQDLWIEARKSMSYVPQSFYSNFHDAMIRDRVARYC